MKFLPNQKGFTLIELIVVVIMLGILAATALPKFIGLGTEARIASVHQLAGSLRSTANLVYAKCMVTPTFNINLRLTHPTIDGVDYMLNYGWLDAGDVLGGWQIDSHINYSGFTASLPNTQTTRFTISNAPDPANCYVDYRDAYALSSNKQIAITTVITGC